MAYENPSIGEQWRWSHHRTVAIAEAALALKFLATIVATCCSLGRKPEEYLIEVKKSGRDDMKRKNVGTCRPFRTWELLSKPSAG